jgi:hypothetical protein
MKLGRRCNLPALADCIAQGSAYSGMSVRSADTEEGYHVAEGGLGARSTSDCDDTDDAVFADACEACHWSRTGNLTTFVDPTIRKLFAASAIDNRSGRSVDGLADNEPVCPGPGSPMATAQSSGGGAVGAVTGAPFVLATSGACSGFLSGVGADVAVTAGASADMQDTAVLDVFGEGPETEYMASGTEEEESCVVR